MSEQKIWVDSELLKYDDLSLCCTKDFDNKFYTNNYSLIDNGEYFEATFKDIKDHDRELVRQVCEKIINIASMKNNDNFYILMKCVMDEVQKEYEK